MPLADAHGSVRSHDREGVVVSQLQNTRLQSQQLFKLRQFPQRGKLRIFVQFLAFLEALFQCLPQILNRQFVAAVFGIHLGHVVVELGALFDAPFLEQNAVGAVVFENIGIEFERGLESLGSFRVLLAREKRGSQIAVDRSRFRRQPERPPVV